MSSGRGHAYKLQTSSTPGGAIVVQSEATSLRQKLMHTFVSPVLVFTVRHSERWSHQVPGVVHSVSVVPPTET